MAKSPNSFFEVGWIDLSLVRSSRRLLYHAEVCVAAERYLINKLRDLSLGRMFHVLTELKPEPHEIDDILDLLQYVYTEDGVSGVPKMKEIVLAYTAAKADIIRQDDRFKLMMHDIGEIGADLVYEITNHAKQTSAIA